MKVGIVGCGLIGRRRAQVAHQSPEDEVVIVADVDEGRAKAVADEFGCLATLDWQDVVCRDDLDVIVVATPNKYLMPVSVAALQNKKHVLCEKPPGRNAAETQAMATAAREAGRMLKVGFNHRHHPAIWKAHEICARGEIGPLMFIRAVYGHGGRPGYDKEWRSDPDLAGGGELLDQGVHVVDLCRWFLGEFSEVVGFTPAYFWGTEPGQLADDARRRSEEDRRLPWAGGEAGRIIRPRVEDNAFALLRTADGRVAQVHTSWTQWKNHFAFEVFGMYGYVAVEGLGGSYGPERLTWARRRESGPPDEEHFEFAGPDRSWHAEWADFVAAIRDGREPLANGADGLEAMRLVAAIYESSRTGEVVRL